ncbi:hypothetical protein [Paenibacillus sp. TH7-28]
MPDLITQLQYNDPITIIMRKGTDDDPYKDRADSLVVQSNGMITLLEIPSITERVHISGMVEIDQEVYEKRPRLAPNEFLVNYSIGSIQVHESLIGKAILCRYKGRGLILYPASRIYALVSRNPDVVVTLQDYIDEIERKLAENNQLIGRVEELISETRLVIEESQKSTDNANRAADEADRARDLALDAYKTTKLAFKTAVADMKELYATYPHPEVGWTVQTYKDGKRYRYDGNDWVLIDIFGENIQPVSEYKDGLMSVAEHLKLKSFPSTLNERVIVIYLDGVLEFGVQQQIIPFLYDGELLSVNAVCKVSGDTETLINIEKSRNFMDWTGVLDKKLHFKALEYADDKTATIKTKTVNKGDMFRVNVEDLGINVQSMSIYLVIRTK